LSLKKKEASMSNPFPARPDPSSTAPIRISSLLDDDDDDDAADDDFDDSDSLASNKERWFSRAGFGSPEWWF
jgi:hypothetical protein